MLTENRASIQRNRTSSICCTLDSAGKSTTASVRIITGMIWHCSRLRQPCCMDHLEDVDLEFLVVIVYLEGCYSLRKEEGFHQQFGSGASVETSSVKLIDFVLP